jgi:hypothetical protein
VRLYGGTKNGSFRVTSMVARAFWGLLTPSAFPANFMLGRVQLEIDHKLLPEEHTHVEVRWCISMGFGCHAG